MLLKIKSATASPSQVGSQNNHAPMCETLATQSIIFIPLHFGEESAPQSLWLGISGPPRTASPAPLHRCQRPIPVLAPLRCPSVVDVRKRVVDFKHVNRSTARAIGAAHPTCTGCGSCTTFEGSSCTSSISSRSLSTSPSSSTSPGQGSIGREPASFLLARHAR
jgi:hypothetical protein